MMEIVIDDGVVKSLSRCSVLLVDDDKFMHEMLTLFLQNTEYSLTSASSAKNAMRMILSNPPDIVITDAMMPGESGFSLIEKMKTYEISVDIPVILWTILEQADGSVMDATGKADILMHKPFYRGNILENLERARALIVTRVSEKEFTFSID